MEVVDAAPAWFQAWNEASFLPLVASVDRLYVLIVSMSAREYNARCAKGHRDPFVVLPFLDGSDPIEAPHNLPPLHNLANIKGLTPIQLSRYCTNYGLGQGRKRKLTRHIGYYGKL
ncbi:hypothetical protein C8R46DRAFT_1074440 [Mycena filopes]|nr:hypothetical protein C8R46DRAFT_1074440 [Mycena filopes]